MNYQSDYGSNSTYTYTYIPQQLIPEIPSEGPPPQNLPPTQLLKQQHYLKLFLHQLQTSTNLPTLSDPQLLQKILKENQNMDKQLIQIRAGKRQQSLQARLLSLSREAQDMMNQMRQFKAVREKQKAELKRLEKERLDY